jgi:hypothetical protein
MALMRKIWAWVRHAVRYWRSEQGIVLGALDSPTTLIVRDARGGWLTLFEPDDAPGCHVEDGEAIRFRRFGAFAVLVAWDDLAGSEARVAEAVRTGLAE